MRVKPQLFCGLTSALLLVCACVKQGADIVSQANEGSTAQAMPRTFTCTFAADTKVDIAESGKTRWEVGDRILVHGENRETVTLTAKDISADGKQATISVETIIPYDRSDRGYVSTVYAAYPADAVVDGNLY